LVGNSAFKAAEDIKFTEQGTGFGLSHRSKPYKAEPIIQPHAALAVT
jgi:hypothetical protein